MALEYYNIEQLAPILNCSTRQLQRYAERGEIPAQRIGGEWRFARPEIISWIEVRIRKATDEDLIELLKLLEKMHAGLPPEDLLVSDLLDVNGMAIPLSGRSPNSVIENLVEAAMNTGLLWDGEKMAEAVIAREAMAPTAMDNGVALLHPRRPMRDVLSDPFIAFGKTPSGIPFTNSRGVLTDVFFLICSVDDTQHLRTLARLSRILNVPDFLDTLRTLDEPEAVLRLFRETEEGMK